ncbi:MAG: hypothetical protein V7694_26030, partial [Rhodococcus sp. (in: high G+C Gram-positive bacteria)]
MNYAFEGFAHEFGRRRGPRTGPFAGSRRDRTHLRGAPFQMWVAQDDDHGPRENDGHRERGHGKEGHGKEGHGKEGHGKGGRRGAGRPFGRGREGMR